MSKIYYTLWCALRMASSLKELNEVYDQIKNSDEITDIDELKALIICHDQLVSKLSKTESSLRFSRGGSISKWVYLEDNNGEFTIEQVLRNLIRNETEACYKKDVNIMFVDRQQDAALAISDFLKYNNRI